MKSRITFTVCCLLLVLTSTLFAQQPDAPATPRKPIVTQTLPPHPRLMLTPQVKERLTKLLETDTWAQTFFKRIQLGAQAVEQQPVIDRKLTGNNFKRMLGTSRDAVHHIITMGITNALTPDPSLRQRMIDEMMSIVSFEDWHPEHFLDTAEMTFAMAVGYDWLYNELTDEQRQTIANAIINHGLKAALKNKGGLNANTNWNQVRHGGLVAGALAVYELDPELAEEILQQAKDNYHRALDPYEGGVYPEGPMYWGYGTSYSFIMAACLQSALGNDWQISKSPGFYESFDFVLHVTAPTKMLVNFADSSVGPMNMPIHMWAGDIYNRPDFTAVSMQSFYRYLEKVDTTSFRMNPLALFWYHPITDTHAATPATLYVGKGKRVHLATLRSSWDDPKASFISLKAGAIRVNHGHMDIGTFIIESDGIRWAEDLGAEGKIYDGRDAWGTQQDSKRWTYFRVNNFSHNTLTLGDQIQQVENINPIIASKQDSKGSFVVMDMSNAYADQAQEVHRGIALLPDKTMIVQDDFKSVQSEMNLRWNMMTKAVITISDNGKTATLSRGGQTLQVNLLQPVDGQFTITDALPATPEENQNSGYSRLSVILPSQVKDGTLTVQFVPGSCKKFDTPLLQSTNQWCQ